MIRKGHDKTGKKKLRVGWEGKSYEKTGTTKENNRMNLTYSGESS